MADDALTAAVAEVHNWHSVAGVNEPRQGITQTVPEPLVLCLSCGWMRSREYAEHLATEVAQVVREHTAAQVAAAKAEGWGEAVHAAAWCLDNGESSAAAALAYVAQNNPYRAEGLHAELTPPPNLTPVETNAWLKEARRRIGDGEVIDCSAAYGELTERHLPDLRALLPAPDDNHRTNAEETTA